LLTEAFLLECGELGLGREDLLRENAERFAAGLQMVNILCDISSDLGRAHCFVPRTALAREGLTPHDLLQRECRISAQRALAPLFEIASAHLDAALVYTLALPASARGIRLFCAIPLWMAAGTLERCRSDPRLLESGHRVKLGRAEVSEIVAQCSLACGDDDALRRSFGSLRNARSAVPLARAVDGT
jgi:farnesyl-diphosphate farnesyltransferase